MARAIIGVITTFVFLSGYVFWNDIDLGGDGTAMIFIARASTGHIVEVDLFEFPDGTHLTCFEIWHRDNQNVYQDVVGLTCVDLVDMRVVRPWGKP